jgi:hypothetical protein
MFLIDGMGDKFAASFFVSFNKHKAIRNLNWPLRFSVMPVYALETGFCITVLNTASRLPKQKHNNLEIVWVS